MASKTDTIAQGAVRKLPCICPLANCPVAAIKQLCAGKQPYQWLAQTRQGGPVPKETMVDALKEVGLHCGMLDVTHITGHSMRVTGAQGLVRAGLTMEQIMLFGRWKSSCHMFAYLRGTAISATIMKSAMSRVAGPSCVAGSRAEHAKPTFRRWAQLDLRRS